jgi:hypothetical protein
LPFAVMSVAAITSPGTAGASAPFSCTHISGPGNGILTLTGCGGGLSKGTVPGILLAGPRGTITWQGQNSGQTGFLFVESTPHFPGGCTTGSGELDVVNTVISNTSKAPLLGTTVSGRLCFGPGLQVSLVKGTTFTL